jgi:hypothetical protein
LSKIQLSLDLSINKTLKLASELRKAAGAKIFESNIKTKLRDTYHSVDEFFQIAEIDYVEEVNREVKSVTTKATVFCNNIQKFISCVMDKRQYKDAIIKVGIDGGGGFLKICLSLLQKNENEYDCGLSKQGSSSRNVKDTSVKQLFIIGIVCGVQENYHNIQKLWNLLKLNDIHKFYVATDLKLANILTGIMTHSSMYPCTWCNIDKYHLLNKGTLRSLESNTKNNNNWSISGGNKNDLKKFGNCIFPPIIQSSVENAIILKIIPPPELHLMMGVVNNIYSAMNKDFPEVCEKWAGICHVQKEAFYGGSFNGNSCRLLLAKVHVLRSICPLNCLKYVQCLCTFELVVKSCFGNNLLNNFENAIQQFKSDFIQLDISVTPKIHAIFYHIEEFCKHESGGLGNFSEQASEAVHADFKKIWARYKIAETHPEFPSKFLKSVQFYNSIHL